MQSTFPSLRLIARSLACAAALASLSTLTACGGGGGDDDNSSPIDKYVGTWYEACDVSDTSSSRIRYVVTKTGKTTSHWVYTTLDYTNTSCSGTGTARGADATSEDTYNGTKVVDGKTVDKMSSVETSNSYKYIAYVNGNSLYFGTGASDAEGYEMALSTTPGATR
ncbi:MAG: hypothetical protein RI907_2483 [Pseudomonadota bacterium]